MFERPEVASAVADSSLDPMEWWEQSHQIAVDAAYGGEVRTFLRNLEEGTGSIAGNHVPLSQVYLDERTRVCEESAARAGVRCARFLVALTSPAPANSPALEALRRHTPGTNGMDLGMMASLTARVDELSRRLEEMQLRAPTLGIPDGPTRAVLIPPGGRVAFPDYDTAFTPPEGTKTFKLSQQYPSDYDVDEIFPWMEIDYRTQSVSYLQSVLNYCIEGNVEVDFRGQDNEKRKWYHAPWMHDDSAKKEEGRRQGREYLHGLTRERRSRKGELHPLQTTDRLQNWAVSLYSPRGGYTLGRVWLTPDGIPDPSNATFPENTVSFKLLFSAAPVAEVPFLKESFTWTANINPDAVLAADTPFNRVDHEMKLLQVDLAVKDPRAAQNAGWVFGTFIYDGSRRGKSPFERLVPVGLSWGDDAAEKRMLDKDGAFLNPFLREAVVNHELIEPPTGSDWGGRAFVRHLGLGGRLNGPVDNPYSSCISCHGRAGTAVVRSAQDELAGFPMPILAKSGEKADQIAAFGDLFRLIRPNSQLAAATVDATPRRFVTVDYSLQISQGIRNFYTARPVAPSPTPATARATAVSRGVRSLPRASRGDDE